MERTSAVTLLVAILSAIIFCFAAYGAPIERGDANGMSVADSHGYSAPNQTAAVNGTVRQDIPTPNCAALQERFIETGREIGRLRQVQPPEQVAVERLIHERAAIAGKAAVEGSCKLPPWKEVVLREVAPMRPPIRASDAAPVEVQAMMQMGNEDRCLDDLPLMVVNPAQAQLFAARVVANGDHEWLRNELKGFRAQEIHRTAFWRAYAEPADLAEVILATIALFASPYAEADDTQERARTMMKGARRMAGVERLVANASDGQCRLSERFEAAAKQLEQVAADPDPR